MNTVFVVDLAAGTPGDNNVPYARYPRSPVVVIPPEDPPYGTLHCTRENPFRSPPILLFVGPHKTPYYVHKEILDKHWKHTLGPCERSKEELIFGEDPESENLFLPDEHPSTVVLFLELIYSRKHEYTTPQLQEYSEPEIFLHVELYFFGVRYGVPTLQSFAIKQIHSLLVKYHAAGYSSYATRLEFPDRLKLIQRTYENTTSLKDELRIMLATDFAMRWESHRHEGSKDGDIEGDSELGLLFQAVPRFERDLLLCLGSLGLEKLPSPRGRECGCMPAARFA